MFYSNAVYAFIENNRPDSFTISTEALLVALRVLGYDGTELRPLEVEWTETVTFDGRVEYSFWPRIFGATGGRAMQEAVVDHFNLQRTATPPKPIVVRRGKYVFSNKPWPLTQ